MTMPTFIKEDIRKARKSHTCTECGQAIERGHRYESVFGVWDGDAFSFMTCIPCRDLRVLARHHLPTWDDGETLYYGNLLEFAQDMNLISVWWPGKADER